MKYRKGFLSLSLMAIMSSPYLGLALPVYADPQTSGDWAVDNKPQGQTSVSTSSSATALPADAADIPMAVPVVTPDMRSKTETGSAVVSVPSTKPAASSASTFTAQPTREKPLQATATTTKLYGRIEQITGGSGAQFPALKAQIPSMDNSLSPTGPIKGQAQSESLFSGTVAKSFPQDYQGNWGGNLKVWGIQQDPICYKIDAVESDKMQRLFKKDNEGAVNFLFANDARGGIYLTPAKILFQLPGSEANIDEQMKEMMGGQSLSAMGPMGQYMQQMAKSMPVYFSFYFGDMQTNAMAKGLSGNEMTQRTLRNTVRQLSPNVLEQQIVAQCNEVMKATGQPRVRYEESVLRFTKVNAQQMYVQAAQVVYGADKKFQRKMIMYGYVTKGVQANTNPYSGMMGMPGAAQIQQMFPGSTVQQSGSPTGMPDMQKLMQQMQQMQGGGGQGGGGFNPFQGLFGQ